MSIQQMCSGEPTLVPSGLRGYRMWNIRGGNLGSTASFDCWDDDGTHTAFCRRIREHLAPVEGCTCGIYGWYRPDEARLHLGHVFGVFEASGRVLLGDFGFRAERGRVLALAIEDAPVAAHCRAQGFAVFDTRDELLAEFPPDDVAELLGHPIPDTVPDVAPGWATVSVSFGVDMAQFVQAMQQVSDAYARMGRQAMAALDRMVVSGRATAPLRRAAISTPCDREDRSVFAAAMEAKRNANRGPERRRRGRARLAL